MNITTPNRRHLCELCKQVFECHLCEINLTHPIHECQSESRFPIYVCAGCAYTNDMYFVLTISGTFIGNTARLYDYITGKLLMKFPIAGRKTNLKFWLDGKEDAQKYAKA